MKARLKYSSAFSLVEVMIAILILGVALVGMTQGITAALRGGKEAEVQTAAAMIAAGRIEMLRADGYLIAGEDQGEMEEGLSKFRWRQSVQESDIEGLYEIKVSVERTETDQLIYELQTLLFDPPLDLEEEEDEERQSTTGSNLERRRERSEL